MSRSSAQIVGQALGLRGARGPACTKNRVFGRGQPGRPLQAEGLPHNLCRIGSRTEVGG